MKPKNIAIISGASSGMGREFASQLDAEFPQLEEIWLIARRKERLEKIAALCQHPCRILPLDLCRQESLEIIKRLLLNERPRILFLINSAGYGILGRFYDGNPNQAAMAEQTGMISLNCEALTALTYLCLPYMRKHGRILFLASSAAFLPQPKFAVYAATKSYVLSFSRALKEELRKEKIFVTAVCPGPVKTEFFERAEKGTDTLWIKKLVMADPQRVVAKALKDAGGKKGVSIYGFWIHGLYLVSKLLPHYLLLRIQRFVK